MKPIYEESWQTGKGGGCVVSDTQVREHESSIPGCPTDMEYYGGYLVCESIGRTAHCRAIALVPEMVRALRDAQIALERHEADSNMAFAALQRVNHLLIALESES